MARKKKDRDALIQTSISGCEDLGSSPIKIENDYLDRERRENLEAQGFNPEDFGLERRENTYSLRESLIHKANKDMEEHESKRDYDPFHNPEIDTDKEEEENMEERAEVVLKNTRNEFINKVDMTLEKAKIHFAHGQVYRKNVFVREWFKVEVTNQDLEVRRIFRISAKEPITINFDLKAIWKMPVIPVESGTFTMSREDNGTVVKIGLNGKVRTFTVKKLISMTEEVEKVPEVIKDPWELL